MGGEVYEVLLDMNCWFNKLRSFLGYSSHWSLSAFLKHKVKNIIQVLDNYQHILALKPKKKRRMAVICGHIHHADITEMDGGKTYCNFRPLDKSCTALAEDYTGKISIICWLEESQDLLD